MIDTECLFLVWGHFLSMSLSLAFIDAVSYLVSKENNDVALPKQIVIRNIDVEFLINNFKILLFFKLGVFCCGIEADHLNLWTFSPQEHCCCFWFVFLSFLLLACLLAVKS